MSTTVNAALRRRICAQIVSHFTKGYITLNPVYESLHPGLINRVTDGQVNHELEAIARLRRLGCTVTLPRS